MIKCKKTLALVDFTFTLSIWVTQLSLFIGAGLLVTRFFFVSSSSYNLIGFAEAVIPFFMFAAFNIFIIGFAKLVLLTDKANNCRTGD